MMTLLIIISINYVKAIGTNDNLLAVTAANDDESYVTTADNANAADDAYATDDANATNGACSYGTANARLVVLNGSNANDLNCRQPIWVSLYRKVPSENNLSKLPLIGMHSDRIRVLKQAMATLRSFTVRVLASKLRPLLRVGLLQHQASVHKLQIVHWKTHFTLNY